MSALNSPANGHPPAKRIRLSLKRGQDESTAESIKTSSEECKASLVSPKDESSSPACEARNCGSETKPVAVEDSPPSGRPGSRREALGPWVAGLANLGNTCFLNSVLEVLRFSPGFLCHLHQLCHLINDTHSNMDDPLPPSWELVLQLHQVFISLRKLEDSGNGNSESTRENAEDEEEVVSVRPRELLESLRQLNPLFEGNFQHDAHELLCFLLNHIREVNQAVLAHRLVHSAEKSPQNSSNTGRSKQLKISSMFAAKTPDLVSAMFEGVMAVRTRCAECEHGTEMKELFLDVGMSVVCGGPPTSDDNENKEAVDDPECAAFREAMLAPEMLRGDNKYWCDMCFHHNEACRSLHFSRLPPVLMVHVKRFSATSSFGLGLSKVSDYMCTPLLLGCLLDKCSPTCKDKTHRYRLFAVITHAGISLSSGHYVSLVRKNPDFAKLSFATDIQKETSENGLGDNCRTKSLRSSRSASSTDSKRSNAQLNCRCCQPHTLLQTSDNREAVDWLQCDDNKVVYLSESKVGNMLSWAGSKGSSWTPYLLFYTTDAYS